MKKFVLSMLMLALAMPTITASASNANAEKKAAVPSVSETTQKVTFRTAFLIAGQKVTFCYQDIEQFDTDEAFSDWVDKNGLSYGNGGYIGGYFYFTTNGAKKKYTFRGTGGMNQGWIWENGIVYLNGKKVGSYSFGGNDGSRGKGSLVIGKKKYTLKTVSALSL